MEKKDRAAWIRNLGLFTVIVSDLIGYTGAGIAIGYIAWDRFHAPWWVLLLTSTAGLVLAMYRMYQFVQKTDSTGSPDAAKTDSEATKNGENK